MFSLFVGLMRSKIARFFGLVCVVIVRSGRLAYLYVSVYMYAFVFVVSYVICGELSYVTSCIFSSSF